MARSRAGRARPEQAAQSQPRRARLLTPSSNAAQRARHVRRVPASVDVPRYRLAGGGGEVTGGLAEQQQGHGRSECRRGRRFIEHEDGERVVLDFWSRDRAPAYKRSVVARVLGEAARRRAD